jgi:hypothetical protein
MARQDARAGEGEVFIQAGAGRGEDFLENPSHREDRRASVDAGGAGRHLAQLAARRGFLLEDGHREPTRGQQHSGYQPADACPDDHDALSHSTISRSRLTPASIMVDTLE